MCPQDTVHAMEGTWISTVSRGGPATCSVGAVFCVSAASCRRTGSHVFGLPRTRFVLSASMRSRRTSGDAPCSAASVCRARFPAQRLCSTEACARGPDGRGTMACWCCSTRCVALPDHFMTEMSYRVSDSRWWRSSQAEFSLCCLCVGLEQHGIGALCSQAKQDRKQNLSRSEPSRPSIDCRRSAGTCCSLLCIQRCKSAGWAPACSTCLRWPE